ncbi:MAG: glycosyltransferase [Proteobacteria bacterium]|nr:glycosyltransferase [Pseudomonadota bacterium]
MRLMQVMAGAPHGGAEAFFDRLTLALDSTGIDQQIVIRRNAERAALLQSAKRRPVEMAFGGALDFVTGHRLRKAVRRFEPDIVLSWMSRATQFAPIGRHVLAARLGGYYRLANFERCDHLVGNTQHICDYLVEAGWPRARTSYLPNFVDSVAMPAVSRSSLDTPEDAPLLFALGRLHANKGFDVLLAALAQIPGAYLWLAGEGPKQAELAQQATRLGVADRVRFLGWRNDAPALFAACDLFICPSRHEPLGNVVIEAWAQNRPVVAAESSGPAALVTEGVSGLLAPVEDADALAAAVRRVLAAPDLAATLVTGGRTAYEAAFTKAKVVARYLEFFESVMD